jgi:hypothetical protein
MSDVIDRRDELPALVRAHLPAPVADVFDRLPARPAIRLGAAQPGDPVVGQLGGAADLPIGADWPLLPDGEPQTFVARLDLAALSGYDIDLDLPESGALLFFLPHLEASHEAFDLPPVVIHVPDGTATAGQHVPEHLRHPSEEYDYPQVTLTAQLVLTVPQPFHPDHTEDAAVMDLGDVIRRYRGYTPDHQVGGYSDAFQSPLEVSAAWARFRPPAGSYAHEDPELMAEARQWVTLLQLDEDSGARMIWGDGGLALWAIRRDDLAARDFSKIYFTTESH